MSKVTIYHNPRCSKSRQTLQLLEEKGVDPNIVLYLETPPDKGTLSKLINQLGITARELIRSGEDEYKAMKLSDKSLSDEALVNAMVRSPKLIQRPIVVANGKAVLGRPPENILDII